MEGTRGWSQGNIMSQRGSRGPALHQKVEIRHRGARVTWGRGEGGEDAARGLRLWNTRASRGTASLGGSNITFFSSTSQNFSLSP